MRLDFDRSRYSHFRNDTPDIHNKAALATSHEWNNGLTNLEHGESVGLEVLSDRLDRVFNEGSCAQAACIVYLR